MDILISAGSAGEKDWLLTSSLLLKTPYGACKVARSVFLILVALGIPSGGWSVQAAEGEVRGKRVGELERRFLCRRQTLRSVCT